MNTKPSSTFRFLESHEVFTLEEYKASVDPTVAGATRYLNLQNAVKRGQAYRLKRGLYASNIGIYRDRVPNAMLVAARADRDAVITHHSALEAHGVAHTPLRTVYFTSPRNIADFDVRGYSFRHVPPPTTPSPGSLEEYVTRLRTGDALVRVTTRERTLIDCLQRQAPGGGLEELLRSISGFPGLSLELIRRYAGLLNSPTLLARALWILDLGRDLWQIDREALTAMRPLLGRGTYWLQRRRPNEQYRFIAEWRLYVPEGLPYEEWLRG